MRLVCDSCKMRYQIADALVRGKVVKLRCRRCSAVIEAHLPAGPGAAVTPEEAEEDLVEAADLPEIPNEPPTPPALPVRKRRVTGPPPLPAREWFLAVGGVLVGPLSQMEVRALIRRGEAGPDDMVWRRGMGTWQPIAFVEPINRYLDELVPGWQTSMPILPGVVPTRPTLWGAEPPRHPGLYAATHSPPSPRPRSTSRAPRPARWPLVTVVLGGMLMVVAAVVWMVVRTSLRPGRGPTAPRSEVEIGPPQVQVQVPAPRPSYDEPRQTGWMLPDPPAIEVRRPRHTGPPKRSAAAPDAGSIPDHDSRVREEGRDHSAALAAQVLRRNRSTLIACDNLAEKRGEILRGRRALFRVKVDADGNAVVEVGGSVSSDLLACYRSVVRTWTFPRPGHPYSTVFWHVR